jgi:peptidyl-Asp metalloendopeptidase
MIRTCLLILGLGLAGLANAAPALWEHPTHELHERLEVHSTAALRGWRLEPDLTLISDATETLILPLPDRTELRLERQRVFSQSPYSTSWAGTGPDHAQVLLTVRGDWMGGLLQTDHGTWEIRPDAEHGTVLLELDPMAFPECSGGLEAPQDDSGGHDGSHAGTKAMTQQPEFRSDGGEDVVIMDLLALYTPAARQALGGTAQIEAHAEAAIANANHSFDNSLVNAQFRIVAIEELDMTESGNCSADLGALQGSSQANHMRDQLGADMVGLLVQTGYCGCGYVMRNPGPGFASHAFQVTANQCAVGNLTYAHEHGHNMGMEHDPDFGPDPSVASYPWSYGHFVSGQFRTVMSYAQSCNGPCPRRMHFSNPNVSYAGHPTGIANARDNARTARLTAPVVAAFREPVGQPQAVIEPLAIDLVLDFDEADQVEISIANEGLSDLEWILDDAVGCAMPDQLGWLDITPDLGSVAPGDQQVVHVAIDATHLPEGMTSSTICLATNDQDAALVQVALSVEVLPEPARMEVSTDEVFIEVTPQDPLAVEAFSIGNSGGVDLEWTVDSASSGCELPAWLSVDPDAGTVTGGAWATIELGFDASGLAPGLFEAQLCIAGNDPDQPQHVVSVGLELAEPDAVISGQVIGLGHCREQPAGLGSALVVVQGQHAAHSTLTDADGQFEIAIPPEEHSVSVTASATGHVSVNSDGVPVEPGVVTSLELELPLRQPCARLSTVSVELRMVPGDAQAAVILDNHRGDAALHWSLGHDGECVHDDAPWLDVSPKEGVISPGNERELVISVQADGLALGAYSGGWCLEVDDPDFSEDLLSVELELVPVEILRERFEAEAD